MTHMTGQKSDFEQLLLQPQIALYTVFHICSPLRSAIRLDV